MQYKFKICAGLFLALFMFGCDEKLDLTPYQSLDESVALTSDANVKTVLNGAYDAIADDDFLGADCLRNSELLGGDNELEWTGTFTEPRDMWLKQMESTNLSVQDCWVNGYITINICNNILGAIPVVKEADRASVEGQALFLRALSYFELVRFYALPYEAGQPNAQPGVPLSLEPTRAIGDKQFLRRSSVAEVYAQIVADLTKAETLLPEDNSWRASKFAATALLSRVYLQMGEYAKARDAANAVIASGAYKLLAKYADLFGRDENSDEDIFAIQVTSQDGTNTMNTYFSIPVYGGRDGDIGIEPSHLALYDPNDDRFKLFFEGNDAMRSGKWNNQYGDIGLIRLAEMYLTRAECNQRLGTAVGATPLADYNTIRARAKLRDATTVTLDEILLDRRRELAHEGFRIHDLRRTKGKTGVYEYNDPLLVFPIPRRDMEANKSLTQNQGY
jgi:starch-binding outer membrane protein, SusD/RagB family